MALSLSRLDSAWPLDLTRFDRYHTSPMTIKVYTTPWCPDCRLAKQFLAEWNIQYEEINIDENPDAAQHVIELNNGKRKVPTFELEGYSFACSPFNVDVLRQGLAPVLNQ